MRYPPSTVQGKKALKQLANGFFGLLFGLCGDLDYFGNVLNLPHYHLKNMCCALCKTNEEGHLSWTNFNPGAPWTTSHWTRGEWHAYEKRSLCPLFGLPGAFSAMVALDFMHCKYLGCDQLMYGSCLALLVKYVMPGSAIGNLQVLWAEIKQWYKDHPQPVQFRYLTKLSMFIRQTGFPKLRGKAAEIRYFAGPMLHVWSNHMNPAIALHNRNLKSKTIQYICCRTTICLFVCLFV